MDNLKTDTSSKINGATSEFRNKIKDNDHQLEKFVTRTGETVSAVASDVTSRTADTIRSSKEYVKENPVKGVALATAAGLMLGSFLTRMMRSKKD